MMQNSLPRLFDGIGDVLRDVVLPEVDDAYVRSQLSACIELLANIATRIDWDGDQLAATVDAARDALTAAAAAAPDVIGSPEGDPIGSTPVSRRDTALADVAEALQRCAAHAGEPGVDDARRALDGFARWHLDHELALLRTGMYRR
jgi:sugar phosphate isomerase/epimerase